jgi:hypothetical protein
MGVLMNIVDGLKRMFINKEGKIQILPKFNLFIFIIIASFLYLKTSKTATSNYEIIALSLLGGNLLGWGFKEVYFRDNYFYSWFGVVLLILGVYICWSILINFYTVIF